EDGQRGLEVALREQPDLVLLDVVMPRLSGLEVCRILKAKAKASGRFLPIMMLSTRNSANARVEGLKSGADDYLGKPYDPEELRVRVSGLLAHRAAANSRHPAASEMPEPEPLDRAEDDLLHLSREAVEARRGDDGDRVRRRRGDGQGVDRALQEREDQARNARSPGIIRMAAAGVGRCSDSATSGGM
ncbi:MAG: response regulator, partial [Gammaproteobacteria bacterium]|nr:response regulator [Gammaproteobacteria bacterium]